MLGPKWRGDSRRESADGVRSGLRATGGRKEVRPHRMKPTTWFELNVDCASIRGCPTIVAHATGMGPLWMTMARPTIDVSPFSCSWREKSYSVPGL